VNARLCQQHSLKSADTKAKLIAGDVEAPVRGLKAQYGGQLHVAGLALNLVAVTISCPARLNEKEIVAVVGRGLNESYTDYAEIQTSRARTHRCRRERICRNTQISYCSAYSRGPSYILDPKVWHGCYVSLLKVLF
jgi:hypothetical protein